MIILLWVVIFVLICIIFYQYKVDQNKRKNLSYVKNKLHDIIQENTTQKLLVVTEDKELIGLLIEINKLLDFSQKAIADYKKKEISMEKMLSNVSHDLKTPLTVILGYIETMKLDREINENEREQFLSKVHKKAIEVIELVNKFFDLAKLEAGDKEVPLTRVNINEICRKNILDFYENLTIKGYDVEIIIPEEDIFVIGNVEVIDRILSNLISNAIKYGSAGNFVALKLSCDENYSYVEIWDKGKGIEEVNAEKVFERMYTLEDSRNKAYQGSGLGLTITKRLVEQLGGEITLVSKPYVKTSFTFKLKRISY